MGRKGTMVDMLWIAIVFVFLGVIIIIGIYLADQIFPQLTDFFGAGTDATNIVNTAKSGYSTMDFLFMFLYFAISLVPIFLAVMVRNHPIFFVVNLLILIAFFLVVPSLSNVVREFWSSEEFAPYSAGGTGSYTFPIMTRLFQYMPLISGVISVMLMIAMFVKTRGEVE